MCLTHNGIDTSESFTFPLVADKLEQADSLQKHWCYSDKHYSPLHTLQKETLPFHKFQIVFVKAMHAYFKLLYS